MSSEKHLVLDAGACEALMERARLATDSGSNSLAPGKRKIKRQHAEMVVDAELVALAEGFIPPKRRIAVVCRFDSSSSGFEWFAMDGVCFHQQQALCGGKVVKVLCDIENLVSDRGSSGSGINLCLECPGHGFLFSLATGDNIVARPQLHEGRMQVRTFKAVQGMQRPYVCEHVPGEGLFVVLDAGGARGLAFASDRL